MLLLGFEIVGIGFLLLGIKNLINANCNNTRVYTSNFNQRDIDIDDQEGGIDIPPLYEESNNTTNTNTDLPPDYY